MSRFELELSDVAYTWNGEKGWRYNQTIKFNDQAYNYRLPIMGLSGNGKSTFLYIIAGLKWPRRGRITWRLPDSTEYSWDPSGRIEQAGIRWSQLRRKFGFAFQDSTLLPHLTVGENLIYPLKMNGISSKDAEAKARTTLNGVLIPATENLDKVFKEFPAKLSGGQKKRVSLAQAMVRDPVVLFADEPTGSLDPITSGDVRDCVLKWLDDDRHRGRRAFIWVTHHPNDPHDYHAMKFFDLPPADLNWASRQLAPPIHGKRVV